MSTITIGGREFRVGATYAPRLTAPGPDRVFRGLTRSGAVRYVLAPECLGQRVQIRAACYWLSWAGEEVAP